MPKLAIVKVRLDREVNGYVVSCAGTKEAVVIDPGLPVEKIAEQVKGLKVRYIVATHCHPGQVAGKDDLKELTGGQTAIHSADAKQFLRSADRYLVDGDELEFGEFKLSVLHTPGHTPGSVCFVVANHAFVGDTILAGGIGKQTPETDLRRQMMSIGTKLLRLPMTTALYPGHGPATSLERELAQNPIFRGAGARHWEPRPPPRRRDSLRARAALSAAPPSARWLRRPCVPRVRPGGRGRKPRRSSSSTPGPR